VLHDSGRVRSLSSQHRFPRRTLSMSQHHSTHHQLLAALLTFALGASLAFAQTAAPPQKAVPPDGVMEDPEAIAEGQAIWQQQCRHCHGRSAYPGKAPKLKPRKYKPDFVFDRISNGFRKMPAWKEVFDEGQRWSIVAFVMSKDFSP
jgi:mono/diheme cytochrome c family protein